MGIEGAVKVGYRQESSRIEDPEEREARFNKLVAGYYERGKALNIASYL